MAFCPPFGMVGNVFVWSSPVDQLAAMDVALVVPIFPCSPYILKPFLFFAKVSPFYTSFSKVPKIFLEISP